MLVMWIRFLQDQPQLTTKSSFSPVLTQSKLTVCFSFNSSSFCFKKYHQSSNVWLIRIWQEIYFIKSSIFRYIILTKKAFKTLIKSSCSSRSNYSDWSTMHVGIFDLVVLSYYILQRPDSESVLGKNESPDSETAILITSRLRHG